MTSLKCFNRSIVNFDIRDCCRMKLGNDDHKESQIIQITIVSKFFFFNCINILMSEFSIEILFQWQTKKFFKISITQVRFKITYKKCISYSNSKQKNSIISVIFKNDLRSSDIKTFFFFLFQLFNFILYDLKQTVD